jgi:hypothetical protein
MNVTHAISARYRARRLWENVVPIEQLMSTGLSRTVTLLCNTETLLYLRRNANRILTFLKLAEIFEIVAHPLQDLFEQISTANISTIIHDLR